MTPQLSAVAEFFPDTTDIDVSRDFFCAEITRKVMYDDEGKARLHSVWSNGLVLWRTLDREGGEMRVTYRRAGSFRMAWPMEERRRWLGPALRTISGLMFRKGKVQPVRVE